MEKDLYKKENLINCTDHDINIKYPICKNLHTDELIAYIKIDIPPCKKENHLRIRNGKIDDFNSIGSHEKLITSALYARSALYSKKDTSRLVFPNFNPELQAAENLVRFPFSFTK